MNLVNTKEIRKFQSFFTYCIQLWKTLIIRTILIKTRENLWKLYYREAVFDREAKDETLGCTTVFKSQDVIVYENTHKIHTFEIHTFEKIWPLIVGEIRPVDERQFKGEIKFGNLIVQYQVSPQWIEEAPPSPRIVKGYMDETPFHRIPIIKDLRWPAIGINLITQGQDRYSSINIDGIQKELIEKNLKAHPSTPFINLEAVADCYMDTFPEASEHIREGTTLCILAPIYFKFEEIALSRKRINLKVRSPKELMKNISVALFPKSLSGKVMPGLHLAGKDFKAIKTDSKDFLWEVSWDFAQEVSRLSILPFINDVVIPCSTDLLFSESPPNLRAQVHLYWDAKNEHLIRYLKGEGKDSSGDFERAVAIVLHIAGYQTENFGQFKGLSGTHDEVDIFAFSPTTSRIYAVECTVGRIEEKVTQIESRVARIRAQIEKCHITSVIATSLLESEIPQNTLEEAGKKGILVLHQNLLVEMLEKTQGNIRFVDFLENVSRKNYLKYITR